MTAAEKIAGPAYWRGQVHRTALQILGHPSEATQLADIVDRHPELTLDNAVLVLIQRPDASDLRTWHQWRNAGREVRHGEKAVALFLDPTALSSGGMLSVFDVSQTVMPTTAAEDERDRYAAALRKLATSGIPIDKTPTLGGRLGDGTDYGLWCEYLHEADVAVRMIALRALEGDR